MGGAIEVVNDVSPWLAARTFTGADTDLGLLRHVLTVPPDCGSMRLFAAHELNTWGVAGSKQHIYDDCWEIVVCPLSGGRPNPGGQDGVAAAWLWGSNMAASDAWANVDSVGFPRKAPVLRVGGPSSGWAVFARPGFRAQQTPADVSVSLHLTALANEKHCETEIDRRCSVPPWEWTAGAASEPSSFPTPVEQPSTCRRIWISKLHTVTHAAGATMAFVCKGGPWVVQTVRTTGGSLSVSCYDWIETNLGGWFANGGAVGAAWMYSGYNYANYYPPVTMQNPWYQFTNGGAGQVNTRIRVQLMHPGW